MVKQLQTNKKPKSIRTRKFPTKHTFSKNRRDNQVRNLCYDNEPVQWKVKHLPRATPRAVEFLENFCSNSPPPEAKKLFKCPIIGPFQVIKCPHPWETFQ